MVTRALRATAEVAVLKVEEAQALLAKCKTVEEAKHIRDKAAAIQLYLRQRDASKEMQADAWEIRYRAETRIGELLEPDREKRGRKKSLLRDLLSGARGTVKNHSSRWQKQALLKREDPHGYRGFIEKERERIIKGETNKRGTEISSHPDHDGDEWCSPANIIEPARRVLGEIDLDPASNAWAQKIVKARRYYTKADNGLGHDWRGRVYANPPYTLLKPFTDKLLGEWHAKRITAAIYLNTTFYPYNPTYQRLLREMSAVCLVRRQIKFRLKLARQPIGSPIQGQSLFYFGHRVALFRKIFDPLGAVLVPAKSTM